MVERNAETNETAWQNTGSCWSSPPRDDAILPIHVVSRRRTNTAIQTHCGAGFKGMDSAGDERSHVKPHRGNGRVLDISTPCEPCESLIDSTSEIQTSGMLSEMGRRNRADTKRATWGCGQCAGIDSGRSSTLKWWTFASPVSSPSLVPNNCSNSTPRIATCSRSPKLAKTPRKVISRTVATCETHPLHMTDLQEI